MYIVLVDEHHSDVDVHVTYEPIEYVKKRFTDLWEEWKMSVVGGDKISIYSVPESEIENISKLVSMYSDWDDGMEWKDFK